jgi:hypothetical protein
MTPASVSLMRFAASIVVGGRAYTVALIIGEAVNENNAVARSLGPSLGRK